MQLSFIAEATNVILAGPNGVGKTTIAQNIVHQALLQGHAVLCATASAMLNDLDARDTSAALDRRLRHYTNPAVLLIDEIGYLSYDSRAADLLFEVVSRRHERRPIILTTNKPFAEWNEVFPNSSSVTALVDRLLHHAEIVKIEGDSYRAKEARERATQKARQRATKSKKGKGPPKNTAGE
jgi:DNA replication protein DnaC